MQNFHGCTNSQTNSLFHQSNDRTGSYLLYMIIETSKERRMFANMPREFSIEKTMKDSENLASNLFHLKIIIFDNWCLRPNAVWPTALVSERPCGTYFLLIDIFIRNHTITFILASQLFCYMWNVHMLV